MFPTTHAVNNVIAKIIKRNRELMGMSAEWCRLRHPDNVDGVTSFTATKAECIEAILVEEFCYDTELFQFPFDVDGSFVEQLGEVP
jgi:hypothetical protein